MRKRRILYSKDYKVEYFACGEKICYADCEVCLQLYL